MNRLKFIPVLIVSIVTFSGCSMLGGGGGGANDSSTTGWSYNDPDNGGFEVNMRYEQQTGPGLVFIEGGSFTMGRTEQDVMYDWNNIPRRVTISSFYMDETEVQNVDYREYLYWIQRVYVSYPQVHTNALPDTLVWRSALAMNEPYVETYFRHPAYNDYPVVGVNWSKANDFCLWRTNRVNEKILIDRGVLDWNPDQADDESFDTEAYLAGQYEGLVLQNLPSLNPNQEERRVKFEDGLFLPKYRLPTEAEWEYAALGYIGNSFDERITDRRQYPWDGHNLRNANASDRGRMMANFKRGRGDMMGVAGYLNDNAEITAPVKSYWPNDFGLYCMAGNVNEWVLDVYRPLSFNDVDDFRPFRGNVFQEKERNPDGTLVRKDSLGRLKYRNITPADAIGRNNYSKADYRNYLDGDLTSRLDYNEGASADAGSKNMYTQGSPDADYKDRASLITDNSRVYKGGSWKDRAYWLNPGTRRFMEQTESTDDIGFRCAMNRVGSPRAY